ncbi:hypothetical protein F5Y11DRAFT_349186 [Daldinia sp. FL1419]|nr:hypothetical protein F5Y11DRAFT_349186 [Daldinia sp. FL1419]
MVSEPRDPATLQSQQDDAELVANVLPVLLDGIGDTFKLLEAEWKSIGSLLASVETVVVGKTISIDDDGKLSLFSWLYKLLGASGLCAVFKEGDSARFKEFIQTPQRLVESLSAIKTESLPETVGTEWPLVRRQLLKRIPTSAIAGLINASIIKEPEKLTGKVTTFLRLASEALGFNISKESVKGVFDAKIKQGEHEVPIMELAGVTADQAEDMKAFLTQLQRLQALVKQPEDIGAIINCKYTSPGDIAKDQQSAASKLAGAGVAPDRAGRIVTRALMIDVTEERLWAEALKARGTSGIADVAIAAADDKKGSGGESAPSSGNVSAKSDQEEINFSTMFGLGGMGCVECASVFSPAAYFVNLLEELDKVKGADSKSLRDKLFERRADLSLLELSCANTKILIPYLDLVNEVMEATLAKAGSLPPTPIPNMGEDDNDDMYLSQPRNTNYVVYEKVVGDMVFPMNVFPYNQAMHSIRAYLKLAGASRYQLLSTFRSLDRIEKAPVDFFRAASVSDRAIAAEVLGLQHEDYVAVTNESYYSYQTLLDSGRSLSLEDYQKQIGLKRGYQYWGYASNTEMTEPSGLTNVKAQFLPRSGLDFAGLLSLLKTSFLAKRLVILNKDRTTKFDGYLDDMRIWQIPLKAAGATENIIDPTLCNQIQAFMRLKNKLQWPIEELDSLYSTLITLGSLPFDTESLGHLAAVKRLVDITGMAPSKLQPLWGDINAYNNSSLYYRLFCKPYEGETDVFLPDKLAGKGDTKLSDYVHLILPVLQITPEEYESIKLYSQMTDQLSLANISQLYRISLLCTILGISPLDYEGFVSIFDRQFDLLKDPATTLAVIEYFKPEQPSSSTFSLTELLFAINGVSSSSDESMNMTLDKAIDITNTILSMPGTIQSEPSIEGDLVSRASVICSSLLGKEEAQKIVGFLEDPAKAPEPPVGEDPIFIQYFSPVLGEKSARDLFRGLTSNSEEDEMEQAARRYRLFIVTMTPIVERTQKQELIVTSLRQFLPELDSTMLRFLLSDIIKHAEILPDDVSISSGMDILLRIGNSSSASVALFNGYFRPPTTAAYVFTISVGAGKDPAPLWIDGERLAFNRVSSNVYTAVSGRLLGGKWYEIQYGGDVTGLTWAAQGATGIAPASFTTDTLVDGQLVTNTGAVVTKLMQLSYVVNHFVLEVTEIEFWNRMDHFNFDALTLDNIRQLEKYQLIRDEVSRSMPKRPLIELYRWLFASTQNEDESLSSRIASVSAWPEQICSGYLAAKYPNLSEESRKQRFKSVSALFEMRESLRFMKKVNFPTISLESLFTTSEPVMPGPDHTIASKDFEYAAIFRSATQSRLSSTSLRNGPTALSLASDEIRDGQRNALVQCLLSDKYRVHSYATTAEKLFGYFLCDVEMGPELQTSRIKQAISTVQLFVQRCILGAENVYGVDDTARLQLMGSDLDAMLRYRLWEARQKAFFYPENWLDPTLRDDKTEQYLALESAVMETKLDMDSITSLVKDYVYRVNEVADLQVEGYLWERQDKRTSVGKGEEDIAYDSEFHVFARTRTSPAVFYYRKLQLGGSDVNIIAYWTPWSRMNVDIPVQDVDGAGNKLPTVGSYIVPTMFKNRLFVFLPEVMSKKKDVESTGGNDDDTTDDPMIKYLQKMVPPSNAQRHWELRLGYIELQNGKWTNKKACQSALCIIEEDKLLPDISGLQFQIDTRDKDILRVQVGRVIKSAMEVLGHFELRDQQLVLVDGGNYPASSVDAPVFNDIAPIYRLEFSKFVSRQGENWGARPQVGVFSDTKPQPLIPTKKKRNKKTMSHRLVMSFDKINYGAPTGFIVESSDEGKSETMFSFPPDYEMYELDPRDATDQLEGQRLKTENISDFVNPMLLKDMNSERGLKPLFATLRAFKYSPDGKPTTGDYSHDIFGRRNSALPHELSTPFAIYNWELGVHIPSLLIERLLAAQQYELALSVARLVFDPTIVGGKVEEAWSFPPFRDEQVRTGRGPTFDLDWKKRMTQDEWLESKSNVHAAARGKPSAYMFRIAMKYIEILIAAGDEYFRQDTLESLPLALQRYTEASQVFGPQPEVTPRLGKPAVMTYQKIKDNLDPNSNLKVDIGLEFPFFGIPGPDDQRGEINNRYLGFLRTDYFCTPANPALVALRNLIDDRLYNIRHGLDINGRKRVLSLFEPPIDPGALIGGSPSLGASSLGGLSVDMEAPMPSYRFNYLLQRAYEYAKEIKETAQQLVGIKEKRDAESLSMLQYKHRQSIYALNLKIKQHQKTEIQRSREPLEAARSQYAMQLQYYLQLTGESKAIPNPGEHWEDIEINIEAPTKDDLRMSPYENMEGIAYDSASTLNQSASDLESQAAFLLGMPDITANVEPWGIGLSTTMGGTTIGQAAQSLAIAMRGRAQTVLDQGSRAGRKSTLSRQLQERLFQANTIGHELMKLDMETEQIDARLATMDLEIQAQQREADNAAAEEEWMRSKYTAEQLYKFLDNSISQVLHQTYLQALDMAKLVRRTLDFEHAVRYPDSTTQPTLTIGGYWEKSRDGLTSGEALYADLKRMEMMHIENATHDFEIEKNISLRGLDPRALLTIQETGSAIVRLPESLFDRDFPGHYCRRIASVALSLPCIVGAYTSINCTLSLTKHKYRTSALVKDAQSLYEDEEGKYRTDRIPITEIAVTNGTRDSGTFSLDFQASGQYGPFEGAGAVSDWQVSLPDKMRQFDYRTISDVVMHLRYTSVNGGGRLKQVAETAVDALKPPTLALNLRDEYPDEWHKVSRGRGPDASSSTTTTLILANIRDGLPFWARSRTANPSGMKLMVYPEIEDPTLKGTGLTAPVTLERDDGAGIGTYTAFSYSGRMPSLDAPWEIAIPSNVALERAWLFIDF